FAEALRAGEELVAVRTGQALHPFLVEDLVEHATGAAVGIGHEDLRVALARGANAFAHALWNLLGMVVQFGRQALDIERVPAVGPANGRDLLSEGSAGEDQGRGGRRCHGWRGIAVSVREPPCDAPATGSWRSRRRWPHRGSRHPPRPPCQIPR